MAYKQYILLSIFGTSALFFCHMYLQLRSKQILEQTHFNSKDNQNSTEISRQSGVVSHEFRTFVSENNVTINSKEHNTWKDKLMKYGRNDASHFSSLYKYEAETKIQELDTSVTNSTFVKILGYSRFPTHSKEMITDALRRIDYLLEPYLSKLGQIRTKMIDEKLLWNFTHTQVFQVAYGRSGNYLQTISKYKEIQTIFLRSSMDNITKYFPG